MSSRSGRRPFVFKQFTIFHDRCAMPLSTDSVLLGSWVPIESDHNILEVGLGCGVVSLMMAQRNPLAVIDAIEIDQESYDQGLENICNSPWPHRINAIHIDFQSFVKQCPKNYDHIVCNPPFFQQDLHSPYTRRTLAKHAFSLSFSDLIEGSAAILPEKGKLSVIIPYAGKDNFIRESLKHQLFLIRSTHVRSTTHMPFIRSLLTFACEPQQITEDTLTLYHLNPHEPTDAYIRLTRPFYLKIPGWSAASSE